MILKIQNLTISKTQLEIYQNYSSDIFSVSIKMQVESNPTGHKVQS